MAFERLPDEIIEQILKLTNANGFASLILLNRKWRQVSQQADLYAYHLSRCPSYAAAHQSIPLPNDENKLRRLRQLFAREIKRNLFEAYLRPSETVISLISTTISSSSAPGEEAFHFSLSPRGHYILAYNSSRINVLDITGPKIEVRRELKILRRPASATITDDGLLLAVLSTDLQVDLYDLTIQPPKHTGAVALEHTPRTIALSPKGSVLAAAYDSGVEVSSLDPTSLRTDRRAVKCYAVDSLSFSPDGTQILGTTLQSRESSTVVLTAPYYDPGASSHEESVSALWTTSILFPNASRDCSHSVLLPISSEEEEASWAFTYDRAFEIFRAVRIDDLRNGTTYFTGPIADSSPGSRLFPSTLPTANSAGDLVAAGFQGAMWIYGIPEDLEALPVYRDGTFSSAASEVETPPSQPRRRNSVPSIHSVRRRRESSSRIPQWQLLCDKFRNTFVEGRKIGTLDCVSAMTWVNSRSTTSFEDRLVAVAPGIGGQTQLSEDHSIIPVDGGRISILDFNYTPRDGKQSYITIELGMNKPEILEEEHRDLDAEVAVVRKRTFGQRLNNRNHVSRSTANTAYTRQHDSVPLSTILNPVVPSMPAGTPVRRPNQQTTYTEQSETASIDEDQEAFDTPYSHTNPRSGTTLRRAATAAAISRRFSLATNARPLEYRRADGHEEHPHESDADFWVPPPPPYSLHDLPPLPEHIQRSLKAETAAATLLPLNRHRALDIDYLDLESDDLYRSQTVTTSSTAELRQDRLPFQRAMSDSTTLIGDRLEDRRLVTSGLSTNGFDDLYDVSPPRSPQPPHQSVTNNQVPERTIAALPHAANFTTTMASASLPGSSSLPTLQNPNSSIPWPIKASNATLDNRLTETECTMRSDRGDHMAVMASELCGSRYFNPQYEPSALDMRYIDVISRDDGNRRTIDFTRPDPVIMNRSERVRSQVPFLTRRCDSAPDVRDDHELFLPVLRSESYTDRTRSDPQNSVSRDLVMPSTDQLARLRSRQGRPNRFTDPRRQSDNAVTRTAPPSAHRGDLSCVHGQIQPQITSSDYVHGGSLRAAAPLGTDSTLDISPQRSSYSPSSLLKSNPSSRHLRNGKSHISHYPSPRPPIDILETLNCQSSNTQSTAYYLPKPAIARRQPSRAGKGAAKNIKDAKKRGWGSNVRMLPKNKGSFEDGTDWTEVSRSVEGQDTDNVRWAKEKKCVVM